MKWNDLEMVDGKFYFVNVRRWIDNEPNEWVFAYQENPYYVTKHYCTAKVSQNNHGSIYNTGQLCQESEILDMRLATQEDMKRFLDYLDRWNYRYCLNTKKLRHVGRR